MPLAVRDSSDEHDAGVAIVKFNPDHEEVEAWTQSSLRKATMFLGIFQIMMIILFASCSEFVPSTLGTTTQGYTYYIGIEIMM
jgi:hypothetical protein